MYMLYNSNNEVIFSSEKKTLEETLEEAAKKKAVLKDVQLNKRFIGNPHKRYNFDGLQIPNANLKYATIHNCDFTNVNLGEKPKTKFLAVKDTNLRGTDLTDLPISATTIDNCDVRETNINKAQARTKFSRVQLTKPTIGKVAATSLRLQKVPVRAPIYAEDPTETPKNQKKKTVSPQARMKMNQKRNSR